MILTSFATVALLGLLAAVLLTIASRLLYVQEDPHVEEVLGALPGANCGGCGFSSCEGYASSVVHNPDTAANLCTAGGPETAKAVGALVGKAVDATEPLFAFCRCEKDEGQVRPRYFYDGVTSCQATAALQGGPDECRYSCIGFGDCARVCAFDAMIIKNGRVENLIPNCTACGACLRACPRHALELIPKRYRVMVHCSTQDKGKAVTDTCKVGCIHCLKCVKTCPAQAIRHEDGRIRLDHAACIAYGPSCGEVCVPACPRSILRPRCGNVQKPATPDPAQAPVPESAPAA